MTIRSIAGALAPRHAKTAAMAAIAILLALNSARAAGDAARGATLYQGCGDCHSIEKNDVGPMHKGVVGRLAGSVAGYNYLRRIPSTRHGNANTIEMRFAIVDVNTFRFRMPWCRKYESRRA
ncbi:hypothetical protein [uncultured Bradyrhizobium sp.]|uniref:c-type cytochrome n=1 Tax=uncultured Bradyrhizobium sp. TaxID=199684 RepID=UPI002623F55A|nr:hypothetical protein [uncultured Bradyrhizobium sp.]